MAKRFIVQKGYEAEEAVNKHRVHEHCPKCENIGMCHYDMKGCGSHWRECVNKECDCVEKLSPLELICSCGKKPEQKTEGGEKLPRKIIGCPFGDIQIWGPT